MIWIQIVWFSSATSFTHFIGAILGIGKIYSVWSTDTLEDNRRDKIILILIPKVIIKICGLIMKIFYNALANILILCLTRLVYRIDRNGKENFREYLITKLNF